MVRILSVVKEIGKSLVVFELEFDEEDLHGILDGNCVNSSECFLDFFDGDIKVVFKAGHRGYKSSGSSTNSYNKRGSIFHPSVLMSLISGWYFSILILMASCENLSLPYLNSINWIVRLRSMWFGGGASYGRPLTQRMSVLRRAIQ